MPREILMPSLSPTMEEGKITKWNKKEGDAIKSGDIIAEIETDKAVMEFEAVEEGVLGKILVEEGSEGIKVNSPIGLLLEAGEDKSVLENYKAKSENTSESKEESIKEVKAESPKQEAVANTNSENAKSSTLNNQENKITSGKGLFITPLAKVIANQNNVDTAKVSGSGPNGRIIKQDILNFINSANTSSNKSSNSVIETEAEFIETHNSGMRKVIAKRLLEAKTTIPHYYLNLECIVDKLLVAREEINNSAKGAYKLSVNDFIIKAVGLAMQDVPAANSYWQGDTTKTFTKSDVAVAVAIPNGLITPIVKDVTNKGLVSISREMKELAAKAKDGKLQPHEYQGGGFSISNLGMFGIKSFSAIINPPQSGILAVGATEKKPMVVNDNIVIANVLNITLSADHRVMDGAVGATFLTAVKKYLENPVNMIL
ncbi:pyruvate dehydrogenase complex dihydrolipoamide acetyltransferase [Rickettsiales bacterium LUAb2]